MSVDAAVRRLTGADMRRIVEALPGSYVHERSVKLSPGRFSPDRFLVTCYPSALGPNPRGRFREIATELSCPPEAIERLLYGWHLAESVHLGCDGIDPPLFKLYVEYPLDGKGRNDLPPDAGFFAVKWQPGGGYAYSVYRDMPQPKSIPQARTALLTNLGDAVGEASVRFADRVLAGILMPDARIAVMRVEDENSPRLSFDVNLYKTQTLVSRHRSAINALCADFGIPDVARHIFLDGSGTLLGHVAIGRDAKGTEFVTLYYGVEKHDRP